jgi:hypothetical protein
MRSLLVFQQHKFYPVGVERHAVDAGRLTHCERGGVRVGEFVYTSCEVESSTGIVTAVPGIVLGLDGGGDRRCVLVLVLTPKAEDRYAGLFALTDVFVDKNYGRLDNEDAPQAKRARPSLSRSRRAGGRDHRR